jgi:hypothetical protein
MLASAKLLKVKTPAAEACIDNFVLKG